MRVIFYRLYSIHKCSFTSHYLKWPCCIECFTSKKWDYCFWFYPLFKAIKVILLIQRVRKFVILARYYSSGFIKYLNFNISNQKLSDYDLSLTCTSLCETDFINCAGSCSDNDCLLICNREFAECNDGRNSLPWKISYVISSLSLPYRLSKWL